VHADIRRARGLPGALYADPGWYGHVRERVLTRTWHVVADAAALAAPGSAVPATLLEGALDEPLLLTRDARGTLRGFANVCTHRGAPLVERACQVDHLRCRYHGRRFGLDGRFVSMPEFDGVAGFPGPDDDLARVAVAQWGPFVFAALDPVARFEDAVAPLGAHVEWMPLDAFRRDDAGARDYELQASWALWCDNYLEGFHVPYVHPALARTLDYRAYRSETFKWASLQIGVAAGGEDAFDLPPGHPYAGERIAGLYFCLFPTTMLNFYPWGLSLNLVRPLGPDRVRVRYVPYVWREERRGRGAGGDLHHVELEDDDIVQATQRGVSSRFYRRARYSPAREACVHHFHRLLAELLRDD
jgi:choline monooxygenase